VVRFDLTFFKKDPSKISALSEAADMAGVDEGSVIGRFNTTGIQPMFSPRLEAVGYKFSAEMLNPRKSASSPGNRHR
jgi:hypothetical protein